MLSIKYQGIKYKLDFYTGKVYTIRNRLIGYEDYDEITVTRQIVINGRNKYMINGHNAQQKQVQTLFHSVGLNVNNPHFLIMQGRITKVLNMNPKEILGLLEEAAGTRMFEDKKNASKKTMVKKEEKVKEIDRIIMEEITPNMKKLKDQRDQYQEWSRNNQQFKRDERFVIAFDYSNAVEELEGKKVEHGEVAEFLKELQENIDDLKKEKDDTSDNIQTLTLKKEEEIEGKRAKVLRYKRKKDLTWIMKKDMFVIYTVSNKGTHPWQKSNREGNCSMTIN